LTKFTSEHSDARANPSGGDPQDDGNYRWARRAGAMASQSPDGHCRKASWNTISIAVAPIAMTTQPNQSAAHAYG
jgi:hypothetical protein